MTEMWRNALIPRSACQDDRPLAVEGPVRPEPSLSGIRTKAQCVWRGIRCGSRLAAAASVLLATALAGPALAADAVVGSGTSASCDENGFDTALDTVQSSGGGTIAFNCGGQHIINFSSARTISSQVVIDGGGLITLSGNNANRLFIVASGSGASFGLRNITLAKGYAPSGDGGAIANGSSAIATGGTLHLSNTAFLDNSASTEGGSGGAIVSYGPVTAIDSRFEGNSAANGGAVYLRFAGAVGTFTNTTFKANSTLSATNGWGGAILLWDGARLTVRGCDFESNSARFGGAIHNQFASSEVVIEQATAIRGNSAHRAGGGLFFMEGATFIDRSFVAGNAAVDLAGGGIYQSGGSLTIADSTIAGNSTAGAHVGYGDGGGIYTRGGFTALERVTMVDNEAARAGGAIFVQGESGTELSLLSSTLSANRAGSGGAIAASRLTDGPSIDLRHVTIAYNSGGALRTEGWGEWPQLTLVNVALGGNSSPTCNFDSSTTNTTARFSLWSDTSCTFGTSEQNHPNTDAALGPLVDNGGWTLTHAPSPGSPLIDNGTCLAGVATDQRGASRLHGLACDIGAVEAGSVVDDTLFADGFEAVNLVAAMESGREVR